MMDEGLVESLPYPSAYGIATNALRRLMQGATLSDAEREAIVRLATSPDHVAWEAPLAALGQTPQPNAGLLTYGTPAASQVEAARIGNQR